MKNWLVLILSITALGGCAGQTLISSSPDGIEADSLEESLEVNIYLICKHFKRNHDAVVINLLMDKTYGETIEHEHKRMLDEDIYRFRSGGTFVISRDFYDLSRFRINRKTLTVDKEIFKEEGNVITRLGWDKYGKCKISDRENVLILIDKWKSEYGAGNKI